MKLMEMDHGDDPEVLVQGVGRYLLSQVQRNVTKKMQDLATTAARGDWKKVQWMLNHAAMQEMVKTLVEQEPEEDEAY